MRLPDEGPAEQPSDAEPAEQPSDEEPAEQPPDEEPAEIEPTLGAVLSRLARRLSDLQVALLASISLAGAIAAFGLAGSLRAGLPCVALAAFGGWAATQRQRADPVPMHILAFRIVCAVAGVAAVFALGLALLASALGTWVS